MYCYPNNAASHGSVPLQSAVPTPNVPSQPLPGYPYAPVYQDPQFSSIAIMSNHLLEQQIMSRRIEPFHGTAHNFWPWVSEIQDYARGLNLRAIEKLFSCGKLTPRVDLRKCFLMHFLQQER